MMLVYNALALFIMLCTAVEQTTTGGENLTSLPPPDFQDRSTSSLNSSSRGFGYNCYVCSPLDKQPCTKIMDCDQLSGIGDRCFISNLFGYVTQGCMKAELCIPPIYCCEAHLCNSASFGLAMPLVVLIGLTTAIIALIL